MEQFAANGHNADRFLCPRVHNLVSTTGHFGKFREWLKGVGLHGDGEGHRLLGLHVKAGNFVALAKIYLEFFNYKYFISLYLIQQFNKQFHIPLFPTFIPEAIVCQQLVH
jgi:hypothetical protein